MADITPINPGAPLPPKPAEAVKVQPKKETVRINLPPKPTSAPTIKLPTLAPGAPPPGVSAAAPAASRAPAPPAPPAAGAPSQRVAGAPAPATTTRAAAPVVAAPAPRPVVVSRNIGLTGLDMGLAIAAAVAGLAGVGTVVYLAFLFKDVTGS